MDLFDAFMSILADATQATRCSCSPDESDADGFLRCLSLLRKVPEHILLVRCRAELVPHAAGAAAEMATAIHAAGRPSAQRDHL